MRKINACKSFFDCEKSIGWTKVDKHKIVFHVIKHVADVMTDDGVMRLVQITSVDDLNNPDNDIALLIPGSYARLSELWYWEDKFWMKGVDLNGVDYYQKKCYALYEVQISNRNELLASLA